MNTTPIYLLIAEDEAAHVEAIRRAFGTAGGNVEIRAVGTLQEFRASVAERPPNLALVDLKMPDGRAVEILTHPPEDAPFPVLVMTAFGNQQIVVEVMKAGALDYVVKSPEAFAVMPHTVKRVIHEWKLLQKHKQAATELLDSNRQLTEALTAVRQMQQQVVQQANLRVLGQMAAGIAHDFNNALAPIIGFSELLLKHPEKVADQQLVVKYLQYINTCGTDAARVVRQMLEFSRQRATVEDYRPLDINKLVRQTIEHTQQRWKDQAQATGRTIQIVTDLLPVQQITGEESAIRELLTNLIFNAVDALPAGGTITLGTMLDGQWVRLSVSDTGTGMTEEVRQHCLEPFFTTKGAEGTGLGLAMVQGIVQRHNGTLEIESQVGQGTTFIIRFSLQHGTPPPVPLKVPALSRTLHVLVVDDEPLLRTVAEAWLVEDGHTVATAENGAAALARLTTGKFDLVITDKAMPNMNGEQLAAAIYKGETIAPVILMTGFGDLMKATGELPPHISAILSKPITQESLREALAKVFPGKLVCAPKAVLRNSE